VNSQLHSRSSYSITLHCESRKTPRNIHSQLLRQIFTDRRPRQLFHRWSQQSTFN